MVFEYYIGIAILLAVYLFDPKTVRIQWNSVASFCGFMAFITVMRIALFDYQMSQGASFPVMPPEIYQSGIWRLAMVFWEDCFYALPIYYAFKYLNKWPAWIFAIILSAHFGAGHVYQGVGTAIFLSIYPIFIANKFGVKYGFGTVMVCHILYDMFTFYAVHLAPILLN